MFTLKATLAYLVALIAGEATLLNGIGVHAAADLNLGIFLQMAITFGSITLPWLGYSPMENPVGTPESERK